MLELTDLILTPLQAPTDPSKRLFWMFLFSSLVMASLAVTWRRGQFELRRQLSSLFSRRYWLHRSNTTDVSLLLINHTLHVLLLVPLLGSHLAGAVVVGSVLQTQLGDAPVLPGSTLMVGIAYTVIFFLMEDLSRFSLHAAFHRIPFLWRFHRTHHSATNLTPLTVHRVHPLESCAYFFRGFLVFSLVSGVFLYLFKGRLNGIDILGVDCLGFLFNFFGANLRHTPIWLGFGALERLFISPAQHQIHHSALSQHHGKNLGSCLSVWDRLCGTWLASGPYQKLEFGLGANKTSSPRHHFDAEHIPHSMSKRRKWGALQEIGY